MGQPKRGAGGLVCLDASGRRLPGGPTRAYLGRGDGLVQLALLQEPEGYQHLAHVALAVDAREREPDGRLDVRGCQRGCCEPYLWVGHRRTLTGSSIFLLSQQLPTGKRAEPTGVSLKRLLSHTWARVGGGRR